MSECDNCGRDDGHWIGCAAVVPSAPAPTTPDGATAKEVAASILAAVGSDQMGELYDALDDLIHEHYEPYQEMPDSEKELWRAAVAEELGGEGYDAPPPGDAPVEGCTFPGCSEPRRSADKRVKFCETHSDPKNRK